MCMTHSCNHARILFLTYRMEIEAHKKKLEPMCRICGCMDPRGPVKISDNQKVALKIIFNIDRDTDETDVHPASICRTHEKLLSRFMQELEEGKAEFRTTAQPTDCMHFEPHHSQCTVCCGKVVKHVSKKRGGGTRWGARSIPLMDVVTKKRKIEEHGQETSELQKCFAQASNLDERSRIALAGKIMQGTDAEARGLWKEFLAFLDQEKLQVLVQECAATQANKIRDDCQEISSQFRDLDFLLGDINLQRWLSARNGVVTSFLNGIMIGATGQMISDLQDADLFSLSHIVESVYGICNKRMVCPFSFMENLSLYTTSGSRYATEVLGTTVPCGSYRTLQSTLNETFATKPAVVSNADGAVVFDNEQVVGKKVGVRPSQKARCSVITNIAFVQLEEGSRLQQNLDFKPKNWFRLEGFESRLEDLKGGDLLRMQTQKQQFLNVANAMINQDTPYEESLEKTHYTQVYYFINAALQEVKTQQRQEEEMFVDNIDDDVKERTTETINCEFCGAENHKRKLVCDKCKAREGLTAARSKAKEHKEMEHPQRQPRAKKFHSKELTYDAGQIKSTKFVSETDEGKYSHVPHGHKNVKEFQILDPAFMNPNSYETVALVLREIGVQMGIRRYGGNVRHWAFVVCDGLPHGLIQTLIDESVICEVDGCGQSFLRTDGFLKHHREVHRDSPMQYYSEFDWVSLQVGLGHYEANLLKSYFDLNWEPFLEHFCSEMAFTSPAAKNFSRQCKDHHLAWQMLVAVHHATLQELVLPYVRYCLTNNEEPTVDGYFLNYKANLSNDPCYRYSFEQVCRYASAIIIYRMGTRRNNTDLVRAGKFMSKELFHGRHHPKYQAIEIYDEFQYRCLPKPVQQLLDAHYAIVTNDNLSSGEGYDYKLEAANRSVKSHLPRAAVPTEEMWLSACRNDKSVQAIRQKFDAITGLKSEMAKPTERIIDVSAAIHRWRTILREKKYLMGGHEVFESTSGKPLHNDLLEFTEKATFKRMYRIKADYMNEPVAQLPEVKLPVCVTMEEEKRQTSIHNQTIEQIKIKILDQLDTMDSDVKVPLLKKYRAEVAGKKKEKYISFYEELQEINDWFVF